MYELRYENGGEGTAVDFEIEDELPSLLRYVSADPAPSAVDGQRLVWSLGDLASGGVPGVEEGERRRRGDDHETEYAGGYDDDVGPRAAEDDEPEREDDGDAVDPGYRVRKVERHRPAGKSGEHPERHQDHRECGRPHPFRDAGERHRRRARLGLTGDFLDDLVVIRGEPLRDLTDQIADGEPGDD